MRDWLINLLGGISLRDLRSEIVETRALNAALTMQIAREREEKEEFKKLLFERVGLKEATQILSSPIEPVATRSASWPRLKRDFEKAHRIKERNDSPPVGTRSE